MLFTSNYLCLNSLWKKGWILWIYILLHTWHSWRRNRCIPERIFHWYDEDLLCVFNCHHISCYGFPMPSKYIHLAVCEGKTFRFVSLSVSFSFSYLKPHAHAPNLKIEFKDCHVNAVEIMLHVKHLWYCVAWFGKSWKNNCCLLLTR